MIGLEPITCWLQISCSAVEPHRQQRARTACPHSNDPNEIRTRVTAVKGRCLNRLTMGPYSGLHGAPPNSPSRTRTYDPTVNSRLLYRLSYRGILRHWMSNNGIIWYRRLFVKDILSFFLTNYSNCPPTKKAAIRALFSGNCCLEERFITVFYYSRFFHLKFGITSLHFSIPMYCLYSSVTSNVVLRLSIFL